ncbi:MAG: protein kinase [Myxococcales bacterium]|nr:protein kinase [Myxococcales bacterium]
MAKESIAQQLFREGLITQEHLDIAEQIHERNGGRHGDILLGLGAISEEEFQKFLARRHHLDYIEKSDLHQLEPIPALLDAIPYQIARDNLLFPLRLSDEVHKDSQGETEVSRVLYLAVVGPLSKELNRQIRNFTNAEKIRYALSTRDNLHTYIRYHYLKYLQRTSSGVLEKLSLEDRNELTDSASFLRKEGLSLPSSSSPQTQDVFEGRWQITELLAEGGMGLIYKGWDLVNHSEVAIKLLRAQHQVDQEAVERLQREAHILENLKHPHLIRIFHSGFEEGKGFYIVMELLKGCSLDVMIKTAKEGLSLEDTERIFTSVCEAMDFAHRKGVIHRDLKPENIFIVGGPKEVVDIKVLDFGIAKMMESRRSSSLTQTGMTLGTPRYLSPEQATGTQIDQRTDIYSLSVILFEALTSQELFQADSPYQYLMKHVYTIPRNLHEAVPNKAFPFELNTVIHQGLAKRPADRPATMGEFLGRLQSAFLSEKQMGGEVAKPPVAPQAGRYRVSNVRSEAVGSSSEERRTTSSPSPARGRVIPSSNRPPEREVFSSPRALSYEELPKVHPSKAPAMGAVQRPRLHTPDGIWREKRARASSSSTEVQRVGKSSVEVPRIGQVSVEVPRVGSHVTEITNDLAFDTPHVGKVSVEVPRIGGGYDASSSSASSPPPGGMPSLLHRPPRARGLSIEELPSLKGKRGGQQRPASVVPMAPIKSSAFEETKHSVIELRSSRPSDSFLISAIDEREADFGLEENSHQKQTTSKQLWIGLSIGAFLMFILFGTILFFFRR